MSDCVIITCVFKKQAIIWKVKNTCYLLCAQDKSHLRQMSLESINAKLYAVKWRLHAKSKLQIELFLVLYDFKNGSPNANDFAFKS